MKTLTLVVALLLVPITLTAQTPPPASSAQKFGWDQPAPTLVDAQAYTYRYYADGATTGQTFIGVTCTGTASPFQCQVPIPAFTPGNHTIQITAANIAGESAKSPSSPFAFTFVVVPGAPANFGIK